MTALALRASKERKTYVKELVQDWDLFLAKKSLNRFAQSKQVPQMVVSKIIIMLAWLKEEVPRFYTKANAKQARHLLLQQLRHHRILADRADVKIQKNA